MLSRSLIGMFYFINPLGGNVVYKMDIETSLDWQLIFLCSVPTNGFVTHVCICVSPCSCHRAEVDVKPRHILQGDFKLDRPLSEPPGAHKN